MKHFAMIFVFIFISAGFSQQLGRHTLEEWQTIIDTTWGEGLPTETKLQIFDLFWNTVDADYAGFNNLDVNWDSLRDVFWPEIAMGVSRGRFYGIISHLYLSLQEAHTKVLDLGIYHSDLKPGIPLLVYQSGYYYNDHGRFGAGLSPLPDSTLLVYKVIDNHPLGLKPGDIILGYDGIPWKILYKELLEACFPITSLTEPFLSFTGEYAFGGSSDKSATHIWLTSAGLNWHLFDTIDVVKYGSSDTLHLQTSPLEDLDTKLICTEQLPVPGVPMPDLSQTSNDMITWGIVEGTQIGYIYVSHWAEFLNAGELFKKAVNSLLDEYQTEGLIIDSRLNAGGQNWVANDGFSLLFNFDLKSLETAQRSNSDDHFAMEKITQGGCSVESHRFTADNYLYDKPIAVLTGPLCWSAGDVNATLLKFHPMTKFFGKPVNTAYTCLSYDTNFLSSYSDWFGVYAPSNFYLADVPDSYLMHVGFDVDEEVWLTPEDVANGEDTVVKAAIAWIKSMIHAYNVKAYPTYIRPAIDTLNITANVKNPPSHNLEVAAIIDIVDSINVDSLPMFDDGNHGDSLAGDGLYGAFVDPVSSENTFMINVSVTDLDSSHYHKLPNASRFTTIGPVLVDHYDIPQQFPNVFALKLYLRNDGATATATAVKAKISSIDSNVISISNNNQDFGNIAPGQIDSSGIFFGVSTQNNPCSIDFSIDISSNGWTFWSDSITVTCVGLAEKETNIPLEYSLKQNYPNPFNPTTNIEFSIPKSDFITLKVYNILGEEVATLVSEKLTAGKYKYDWDASGLASGMYLYRILAGSYVESKKMVLLR